MDTFTWMEFVGHVNSNFHTPSSICEFQFRKQTPCLL